MQAKLPPTEPDRKDVLPIQFPAKPPDQQPGSQTVNTTYALIGSILQGGVILSAAVILTGLIMVSLQPYKFAPQKPLTFPQTFGQVWMGLLTHRPQSVIALGLLLLIATPVVRVAVSIIAFAVEGDRRFAVMTTLVLLILLFSIFYVGAVVVVGQHQSFQ